MDVERKASQYLDSQSGSIHDYKRSEDIALKNVYVADFETSSLANYDKTGRVHVFLWSLINCESREVWIGKGVKDFLRTVKERNAKIVYFPQSQVRWYIHRFVAVGTWRNTRNDGL